VLFIKGNNSYYELLLLLQYEKEKAEKSQKRVEGERDGLNTELIQARVELSKVQGQSQQVTQQQAALQETIDDLTADKEIMLKAKQEVSHSVFGE
jgi:uncharacterized protein (DUF3084 family)